MLTGSQGPSLPEKAYSGIVPFLTIRMRLSVIYLNADDPKEWLLRTIRHSRLSSRIINLDSLFKGGKLGELRDQAYLESSVLPAYAKAIEVRQPLIDTVEARLVGVRVVYDRIILPQKSQKPQWLLICTHGRFMAGAPASSLEIDATDEAILTALMQGMTVKEIGAEVALSPRTVEHRLERVKKQIGARSLPHLAVLLVTAGFDRSIHYVSDN
ncbi:helix-turn-helix transcriptional regulator [Rhizobium tubonense]|nr:LuxR C-terminal-related transcriptional regulator [Rhizobium tubonense]